mmetsp:Transcript_4035/g.8245  ORF Transcript_4035/g.8245 Transcript_4035/m.8245 type:complete len:239 (+) Transcript_4035:69-785(+)
MSSSDDDTLYIIVGVAAGGGLAACVALAFLAVKGNRQRSPSDQGSVTAPAEEAPPTTAMDYNGQNKMLVSSEIIYGDDEDQDISTLGDPVLGTMNVHHNEPDEQTASVENDYDYHKQYMKSQGIASLDSNDRISSDASLDIHMGHERFEVTAPPGKLGMVIDTPSGGVPVVHAIKEDSVMRARVRVGDRLISVDGDDVSFMTAMQVSQLIALKSDQSRLLVFVRGIDAEYGGGDSLAT